MGGVKKYLKKSLNFTKDVYGGGYVRDMLKNPKKGFNKTLNEAGGAFGVKIGGSGDGGKGGIADTMNEATAEMQAAQARQTHAGLRAMQGIKPAYAAARSNIQVGKGSAMQGAADRGVQSQASAQQSLAARGMYNTTVMDNASRGISSGVTRDLADIEASYGQMMAQLDIGESQALTQGHQFLSGTYGQQGQSLSNLKMQQAGLQAQLYEDPDQWLNDLLGIVGTGVGMYFGGLGGAALTTVTNQGNQHSGNYGNLP
jgi:hypothetical protein